MSLVLVLGLGLRLRPGLRLSMHTTDPTVTNALAVIPYRAKYLHDARMASDVPHRGNPAPPRVAMCSANAHFNGTRVGTGRGTGLTLMMQGSACAVRGQVPMTAYLGPSVSTVMGSQLSGLGA